MGHAAAWVNRNDADRKAQFLNQVQPKRFDKTALAGPWTSADSNPRCQSLHPLSSGRCVSKWSRRSGGCFQALNFTQKQTDPMGVKRVV
jgi:hypothetical protein